MSGWRAADLDNQANAWIAATTQEVPAFLNKFVLINIGVNDIGVTSQASFEASLGSLLDKIHTAWPTTHILVAKVWKRGFDSQCDTMDDTWIVNVLSGRSSFASAGPDERTVIKAGDNGAANTTDGVHYSTAGNAAWAAALKVSMGY